MPAARYAAVDSADLLGGRAATIRIGYAAREADGCQDTERDCGQPLAPPYHACCTKETRCVSLALNARCCAPGDDCSSRLDGANEAQCANEEHDMYYNDGYFCCEQGKEGYMNSKSQGDGCGDQDYVLQTHDEWLPIVASGKPTSGASSKSTGAPSATKPGNTSKTSGHTSATNPSQSSGSSSSTATPSGSSTTPSAGAPSSTDGAAGKTTNGGAIAGGVIGGLAAIALIAVLLWFIRRRKARSYAPTNPPSPSGAHHAVEGTGPEEDNVAFGAMGKSASAHQADGSVSELPGKERGGDAAAAAELYGQDGKRVAEMYSPSVATTAELHGVERGPGELPAWDGRGVPGGLQVRERGGPVELP